MRQAYARNLLVAVVTLTAIGGTAHAATKFSTMCQKRLSDGEIMVSDGTKLPASYEGGFKVVSYRATRTGDGWSFGPCVITPRR
jgi:hypothetical protein